MADRRSAARLRVHYELEKNWANRLKRATPNRRKTLYSEAYDAVFSALPDHPQITEHQDLNHRNRTVQKQWRFLRRFLHSRDTLLEIGTGDAALASRAARLVRRVIAIDVSEEITRLANLPQNVQLKLTDGIQIPMPDASIDIAYSNQLMEHLHPDDAEAQLRDIVRVLRPGGLYICITPNRFSGPHDISGYFDAEATGFHLKEYDSISLSALFRSAGFSRIRVYIGAKGFFLFAPIGLIHAMEWVVSQFSFPWRRHIGRLYPIRAILGLVMVGEK